MSSWILSSLVRERVFFGTIVTVIVSLLFVVEVSACGLRRRVVCWVVCRGSCLFVVGSCCRGVGWNVIISFTQAAKSLLLSVISSQHGLLHFDTPWAGRVVTLIGTSPCTVVVVGVVLVELTGSCCRGVGWNVLKSFTQAASDITSTLHGLVTFAAVRCCVVSVVLVELTGSCCRGVGWNVLKSFTQAASDITSTLHGLVTFAAVRCCVVSVLLVELTGSCCRGVGWNVLISFTQAASDITSTLHGLVTFAPVRCCVVSVVLCGLVVMLIGTSTSLSLWIASLGCCVCDIEPKWPSSLRHSMGWSPP